MWQEDQFNTLKQLSDAVHKHYTGARNSHHIRFDEARDKVRGLFMKERGFKKTLSAFTLWSLATGFREDAVSASHVDCIRQKDCPIIDHAEYYTWAKQSRERAAIVTHVYSDHIQCHEDIAKQLGLTCERLDWSWYYPVNAMAVLYTSSLDTKDRTLGIVDESGVVHAPTKSRSAALTICDGFSVDDYPPPTNSTRHLKRARCVGKPFTCFVCINRLSIQESKRRRRRR